LWRTNRAAERRGGEGREFLAFRPHKKGGGREGEKKKGKLGRPPLAATKKSRGAPSPSGPLPKKGKRKGKRISGSLLAVKGKGNRPTLWAPGWKPTGKREKKKGGEVAYR